jgi:NADPH:quinone reductase-like Zn-dependent oxidoreductase
MTPTKQRAAIVSSSGVTFGLADVPKPGPGQILVKVVAAAQNPTDCQFRFVVLHIPRKLSGRIYYYYY